MVGWRIPFQDILLWIPGSTRNLQHLMTGRPLQGTVSIEENHLLIPRPVISDSLQPIEYVSNMEPPVRPHSNDQALVLTIHDGAQIPRHLFGPASDDMLSRPEVVKAYARERDWGANLVAKHLAREVGLGGFLRINLARVVMDFGRFPGTSSSGQSYLRRNAIYPPIQDLLSEAAKQETLERYYDPTSLAFVDFLAGKRVSIAVHTYDRYNHSGTERPEVSLVSRSLSYQNTSTIPPDVFDPLFPPILGEATCHRILTYQALVNLERGGWHTALNYPYVMPEGSLEIRAQVWFFFQHLRRHFTTVFPHTAQDPAFERVWLMLTDAVRRSGDGERLRAYLHHYRPAPPGEEALFFRAREAYDEVSSFLKEQKAELVESFRFAHERLSCLGIEVRKDLLSELDDQHLPFRQLKDADATARDIARHIGSAVRGYLEEAEASDLGAMAPMRLKQNQLEFAGVSNR
jgi:hypothetical protein